jgi:hypothetical protein
MADMPDIKLKPVVAGRSNKPAWCRTHAAAYGPDVRAGEGDAQLTTTDVYLDGERTGSITGIPVPGQKKTAWAADGIEPGVKQHRPTRFHAVDALVRSHLTELRQHPIAHLAVAA